MFMSINKRKKERKEGRKEERKKEKEMLVLTLIGSLASLNHRIPTPCPC
jgi:hypothetical protein